MISKSNYIEDSKGLLGQLPAIEAPVPDFLFAATENARCPKAEIFIKEGDRVLLGQKIGVRHAAFFDQPIHSTCSGTFIGYEKHYHRSGKLVNYLKIQNDHLDEWDPSLVARTDEEVAKLTKDELTEILKETALVGLGGSSFPTYIKLQGKNPVKTILVNGIECEPYISADHRIMLEQPETILKGILLLMQVYNCNDARICVKSKYSDLRQVFGAILKRPEYKGITLCPVGNFYPQGWEIAMIKSATGIQVESGHLPGEYGIANFNVSTVSAIYEAAKYNRPVYERLVSVTGDGIAFPSNFRVRLGTPLTYLLDACGGFVDEDIPKVLILGGPMMGASEPSADCIVTKTVTSCIVLNAESVKEEPCIRCGSCVLSCPTGLEPQQIMQAVKANDKERVKELKPMRCIECGLCTYVCTSKIRVTDFIRRAKVIARLP
ncbi:MAG: RnfABCDGE type electron transport complex subunit C [Bacilli bacterium]|nr:RnfABCDGE type electron transport complex subunit C [Bacilli bacterium]